MGSIASELKLEREKRNVSLAQIAENTNISLRHLQSIEDGRFCDLPGGMYNRAFLRAYCASLDLNQKELLQKYEREYSSTSDKTVKHKLQANKPVLSLRPGPVVLWSFIVLIFIAGIFIGRTYIAEIFSPYISDTSASRQENPQPVHPIAGPPAAAVDPGSPALFKSTSPEETGIHSDGAPYPFPASAAGLGPAAGDVSIISPFQALHLEIIGKEQCWISITH
ncbi:MAG TPA: helix-turn-helix domain-containing protein, partial [Acidobacteriota bacterium]|nr:helix-turn-helix domain-containing protein [Acidobacteriota bacterium]